MALATLSHTCWQRLGTRKRFRFSHMIYCQTVGVFYIKSISLLYRSCLVFHLLSAFVRYKIKTRYPARDIGSDRFRYFSRATP